MLLNIGIGTIVISSIVVFLSVILILVMVLLYAKKKLTPQGDVKITLNGEREIITSPGSTVLATLAAQKVYLPSACGGGGTCGMCTCQVISGGGTILPTEKGFFTRKEQLANWRLGCQVKVREDMEIEIPAEIFGIKKWECTVISNRNVATFIKEFVVQLPEGENMEFKSGGLIAEAIAEGIQQSGEVDAILLDVEKTTIGELDMQMEKASGIIVGSPTINQNILLPIYKLFAIINPLRDKRKLAGAFGSYGWSGEGSKLIENNLRNLKLDFYTVGMFFKFTPNEIELEKCRAYGRDFAAKILEEL